MVRIEVAGDIWSRMSWPTQSLTADDDGYIGLHLRDMSQPDFMEGVSDFSSSVSAHNRAHCSGQYGFHTFSLPHRKWVFAVRNAQSY